MRNYKYFLSIIPGLLVIAGNLAGGWWVMTNLIFSLVVLAAIEWFFPDDTSNESDSASLVPDSILVLHVIIQILALSSLFFSVSHGNLSPLQIFLACLSAGINSGSGAIVVAHEMIHRKEWHWQLMGKFLLLTSGNIYCYIEHLRVHHKHVGTAEDPATAKLNESLYSFYARTTV